MTGNPAALYRRVSAEAGGTTPDAELLARFAADRDGDAFAELVRRHGPVVLGVCRRTVGHVQDAEDAFQATFLVLAKKAGRISRPELLGNWLYGVAVRVAAKARRRANRRAARERTGVAMPDPPTRPVMTGSDVSSVLDAEIDRLPAHYRDAILLCDVQGMGRPEAALKLGVPDGTLSSRLSNGRKKLANRLAKRGVTLPTAGVFLVAVPDAFATRTVDTALAFAAGSAVPYAIFELTRTGGSAMRYVLGAAVLAGAGLVAGTVAWSQEKEQNPPKKSEVAKAEEPKPGTGGNEKTIKPKRVKTIEIANFVQRMHWSSDGRYLVTDGSGGSMVIDTQTFAKFDMLDSNLQVIGFLPGTHTVVAVRVQHGRINADNYLHFSSIRMIEREGESPTYRPSTKLVQLDDDPGFWWRLLPDGKRFVSISVETINRGTPDPEKKGQPERSAYTAHVRDLATGASLRDIPLGKNEFLGSELAPNGKSLVVLGVEHPKVVVRSFHLDGATPVWSGEIKNNGRPLNSHQGYSIVYSPDGKRVSVAAPFDLSADRPGFDGLGGRSGDGPPLGRGGGGRRAGGMAGPTSTVSFVSFDAESGRSSSPPFANQSLTGLTLGNYSSDGKLTIDTQSTWNGLNGSDSVVEIRDVESGRVVKSWNGFAKPSFSPGKPLLALAESFYTLEENKQVAKTALGFWDYSAPAK